MLSASTPPTGTITFLFTDIEGSTALAQAYPVDWEPARQRHHAILRNSIESHHGFVFQVVGDAFCAAFTFAPDALAAALDAQHALQPTEDERPMEETSQSPSDASRSVAVRVRMGLHTGPAEWLNGEYDGYLTLARAQRIMSAGHGGQVLLSLVTAELVRGALPAGVSLRDLGDHRLKSLNRPEHLFQLLAPALPGDFPALASVGARPNNLPVQLTSFIGRLRETVEVKRLLTGTRLLTLTGSGGTGKTRLSQQVAGDLLDAFPNGICFVELAPLAEPALVPQTVATALSLREEPGRPILATLTDYLCDKHLLLMLDNCEHLLTACAHLADTVLRAAPRVTILATSREALGIAGEAAYHVPSLPSPNPGEHLLAADLARFDAVRLFAERAVAAKSTFALSDANAAVVSQICHRLDGIPLAIELAAARIKMFPPEQIAARLDDRFRLLTGGSRTALPRQQTLRALIDWSYALLSEPERILLRRLSVFAGGWTLEAAESICDDEITPELGATRLVSAQFISPFPDVNGNVSPGPMFLNQSDVLDLLSRLIEKSLVIAYEANGEPRYRMLETIRQYARDKLLESGEGDKVRDRHLEHFARFAFKANPELDGRDQIFWLDRFESDHDNLRAALEWSFSTGNVALQLQLPTSLFIFWFTRGYHTEGAEALRSGIAKSDDNAESAELLPLRLLALSALINMYWAQDRLIEARPYIDEALRLAEKIGTAESRASAYRWQGAIELHQGNYVVSHDWLLRGLDALGSEGDRTLRISFIWFLGDEAYAQSHFLEARSRYEEILALFSRNGDKNRQAYMLRRLGYIAVHERELGKAAQSIFQSLTNNLELAERQGILSCLAAIAALSTAHADWARAAKLCGCVASLLKSLRFTLLPMDQVDYERTLFVLHQHLDGTEFDAAWAAGAAMTLDQAVDYAFEAIRR